MTVVRVPPSVPLPQWFNATVISWHDGDTGSFLVTLDPTEDQTEVWVVRLPGCNAIELGEPGGPEARDALVARLPAGTAVVLGDVGEDKFGGRLDARVFYAGAHAGAVRDLTTDLIADGWAAPWNGTGKKPVPVWPRPVAA